MKELKIKNKVTEFFGGRLQELERLYVAILLVAIAVQVNISGKLFLFKLPGKVEVIVLCIAFILTLVTISSGGPKVLTRMLVFTALVYTIGTRVPIENFVDAIILKIVSIVVIFVAGILFARTELGQKLSLSKK